jgi:translation elongation factor EF-G
MKVEVVTPEDYMGDVIGDLNSRRGQIQGRTAAATPRSSRDGAAGQHVRLREHAALDEPGPRPVHDDSRPLRAGPAGGRRRSPGEVRLSVPTLNSERTRLTLTERSMAKANLSGTSRTATSARLVTLTMARRR